MTQEEAKKEAIRKAYVDIGYEHLYHLSDDNGWIRIKSGQYQDEVFKKLKLSKIDHAIQPKSLEGITNNNGWIRVLDEGSLPEGKTPCFFLIEKKDRTYTGYYDPKKKEFVSVNIYVEHTFITHYQPIVQPQPPIY